MSQSILGKVTWDLISLKRASHGPGPPSGGDLGNSEETQVSQFLRVCRKFTGKLIQMTTGRLTSRLLWSTSRPLRQAVGKTPGFVTIKETCSERGNMYWGSFLVCLNYRRARPKVWWVCKCYLNSGSFWVILGSSLGHPGVMLGYPGVLFVQPRVIWGHPRVFLDYLEVIRVILGSHWVTLGSFWVI